MRIGSIKSLALRRAVMIAVAPFVLFQYLWLGLKGMAYEFKQCWNFRHEETPNV